MIQNPLKQFGIEIQAAERATINSLNISFLKQLILKHRVCVLRDFQDPSEVKMLSFCRQLGAIRQWEHGEVIDLQAKEGSQNYLFTNHAVSFHWDGAFASVTPNYIFFHCVEAPETGSGGETIFCDGALVLNKTSEEERNLWRDITITYRPDTVVHEGFSSPLVMRHPVRDEFVLRYAEPVEDLNRVSLKIQGLPPKNEFIEQMRSLLYDPNSWYVHSWKKGDVIIADNHALLHGRTAFRSGTSRHLRKVNIL